MTKQEIVSHLEGCSDAELFERAGILRSKWVGQHVQLRGLIELSNICACDCLYCGIRKSNSAVERYKLDKEHVIEAARYAHQNGWGAVVLQSGELRSESFTAYVEELVHGIKELSAGELVITLSCGVQSEETLRRWHNAGAEKYLLRIESSNPELFAKIHPREITFTEREEALDTIKRAGYITGSGIMIGLPHQEVEDIADDLLWLRNKNIDMCGMGPYIEHPDTPLHQTPTSFSKEQRVLLTLRSVAILRILMPQINIASSTALGTLDKSARLKALSSGANVLMPCLTPELVRKNYKLYENKVTDLDLTQL